jgi:hypothetical protein
MVVSQIERMCRYALKRGETGHRQGGRPRLKASIYDTLSYAATQREIKIYYHHKNE